MSNNLFERLDASATKAIHAFVATLSPEAVERLRASLPPAPVQVSVGHAEPFAWTWKHPDEHEKHRGYSRLHPGYLPDSPYEVTALYPAPAPVQVAVGSGDTVMKADVEKMIRDWQTECADHPALHNQGNILLDRLRALKPSLAMNDFLAGMDCIAAEAEG